MTASALSPADRFGSPDALALPVHLTRFVGRETELTEILRLLAGARLLTLTGAGGSGKTRLACEVAVRVGRSFAHVGWVDLASINDSGLVSRGVGHSERDRLAHSAAR